MATLKRKIFTDFFFSISSVFSCFWQNILSLHTPNFFSDSPFPFLSISREKKEKSGGGNLHFSFKRMLRVFSGQTKI